MVGKFQEVESRTQGSKPRPRTQKKSEAKAKEKKCSRPSTKDTNACVFLRKKVLKNFFWSISKKNGLEKHFSADLQNFNYSKNSTVLEPRTRQFLRTWGFEAKAKDLKLRPRGQGRPPGLHLYKLLHKSNEITLLKVTLKK